MWSLSIAIRAGFADGRHDLINGGNAGVCACARKRTQPGFIAGPVPGLRVRAVSTMAVMIAFRDGALLDQYAQCPAIQGAVGRPGGL